MPSAFFHFFWVTGELSTLRQLMKVPNEPGLSPNNGLENVSPSDQSMASNPRKGQAKCPGAKTTSHDGRAGHVMTHMCHPSKARRMESVTIQVPMQGICTPATRIALWPAKLPSQAMSSSRPRARWPVKTCEKRKQLSATDCSDAGSGKRRGRQVKPLGQWVLGGKRPKSAMR